jgi:hypothetical protein
MLVTWGLGADDPILIVAPVDGLIYPIVLQGILNPIETMEGTYGEDD